MAEKNIYRYTIHKVALRKGKPLKKGELRAKDITVIIKRIQRGIKKIVTKQKIPLLVRVYNIDDKRDKFSKQYDDKHDFKGLRKPAKWRKALSRKAKFSRTFDPSPTQWFVMVGKRKQLALTKLGYEPSKGTLLRRKRKRLIGPFQDEATAKAFIDRVEQKREELTKTTEFKQGRRYKGPMVSDDPTNMHGA